MSAMRPRPSAAMRPSPWTRAIDGRPWLRQQRPPAAAERQDRADVVLARQVPQPVRVVERLERAAAALREGERSVDEGQREAADRDHRARRDSVAREPAIDREDARAALMADGDQQLVVGARRAGRVHQPAAGLRLGRHDLHRPEAKIDVRRGVAPEGVEAVGEVAADLGAGRVVARVRVVMSRSPDRECLPLGRRHGPALGPPHVDLARREVHAEVLRLRGIVDRAGSRHGCGSKTSICMRIAKSRLRAWSSSRSSANRPLGPRPAIATRRERCASVPGGGRPRQLGNDENTPSPMRSASLAGSQPSSRSTQPSS